MSEFTDKCVKGILKKKVDGFNMESYPSRFHILDFHRSIIIIKRDRSDKENDPSVKKINFRDIIDCYLPLEKHEAIMREECH